MSIILCFAALLIGAQGASHTVYSQPPDTITSSSFQSTDGQETYEVQHKPKGEVNKNKVLWKIDSINLNDGNDDTDCGGKLALYTGEYGIEDGVTARLYKEFCETDGATDDMVYMTLDYGTAVYTAENDQVEGFSISFTNFTCGGGFDENSGTVSSPTFENGLYPNHASCAYVIHAPEGTNVELTLTELDFPDDEGTPADCKGDHDKVTIFNGVYIDTSADHGHVMGTHCNGPTEQTTTYASYDNDNSGNGIAIQFLSNGAGRGVGFKAEWSFI